MQTAAHPDRQTWMSQRTEHNNTLTSVSTCQQQGKSHHALIVVFAALSCSTCSFWNSSVSFAASPPDAATAAATCLLLGRCCILMCSKLSTWFRQIGHLLVCLRSSLAHSWHMHICRQGSTVVSLSLLRQMTQSLSSMSSSRWCCTTSRLVTRVQMPPQFD